MNQLLLHDSARLHTSLYTSEAVTTVEWTVLPDPPCCPDLAPSNFHIFGPLKAAVQGRCSADDTELKQHACKAPTLKQRVLCNQHTASRTKVERMWIMKETLWKNNNNFVKDVPMIYVNFILIVIVVKVKESSL
jgi:hypothetical protein